MENNENEELHHIPHTVVTLDVAGMYLLILILAITLYTISSNLSRIDDNLNELIKIQKASKVK